jgi:energy-coupling factor transporter ATP-binding protein EcfA2
MRTIRLADQDIIRKVTAEHRLQITFGSSYLSIHSLPSVELPDFCLITGVNGAGKSHFLQALQAGNLRADCAPNQAPQNQTEIRLFDWNSLVPQDTGVFMSENLRNERVEAYNHLNGVRAQPQFTETLRNTLRQWNLPDEYIRDPNLAITLGVADLGLLCGTHDPQSVYDQLQQASAQTERQLLNSIGEPVRSRVRAVAAASRKPLRTLTQKDFFLASVSSWGEVSIFQQSFARLFVAYRDAYLANQMGQFLAAKGETEVSYVSDEEFLRINGPAPWKFVNESLAAAGLDFKINQPMLNENTPFQPELTKVSTGVTIPFGALSSGEKVLMSFAFCVYYSNDRRQLALHPKMILLDEVDAPLHPSMSKNLIQTVRDTLVRSYGIKVILTTHSPSTVAMAPEEAVYVMNPGRPGLSKCSRAEALNILTVGVPTLSISYEGRRQVFVESPSDAKTYDAVYKL